MSTRGIDRRMLLQLGVAGSVGLGMAGTLVAAEPGEKDKPVDKSRPTKFQIACMTLPYSAFPLQRALTGLKSAGYHHVAWGQTHKEEGGKALPVLAGDAPLDKAKEVAQRCRDLGLEPLMLFGPSPDQAEALKHRVRQAAAAGIGQVLTFGHTRGNNPKVWIDNFKKLGP